MLVVITSASGRVSDGALRRVSVLPIRLMGALIGVPDRLLSCLDADRLTGTDSTPVKAIPKRARVGRRLTS